MKNGFDRHFIFLEVYYLTEAEKYFDPINKVQKMTVSFQSVFLSPISHLLIIHEKQYH